MKRLLTILLITLSCVTAANAQQKKKIGTETAAQKEQRMSWWSHDRFGMFIHFGLYAMPARHEWVRNREYITNEEYQPYFDLFNPDLYNAKEWAKRAKAAGMKYAVLTTKHHEGFCLYDSKFTEYKITNTPFKRDLVKEFVEAFRAEGIKVGFYYSLLDWHHPDFTVDFFHPLRPKKEEGADSVYVRLNKDRDMAKYRKYLHNQITELLTKYGKIDIMWMDFSYPGKNGKGKDDWASVELLKLIRKLQPGIIVDNRLDLNDYEDGADFATPEQVKPSELKNQYDGMSYFETCQTFSGSWGYYRDENTWKSNLDLLTLLITSVSRSGNLILNVGPTARGTFDYRAISALDSIGQWMQVNNRAVYGCKEAPAGFAAPENTLLTYNPLTKRLYIHLLKYSGGRINLSGYAAAVKYTQFLHDNSEIKREEKGKDLVLTLPDRQPPYTVPVIEVVLK